MRQLINIPWIRVILYLLLFINSFQLTAETLEQSNDGFLLLAENSWPPFSMPDGKGVSTSIVTHAYASAGIIPKIEVRPYGRVLAEVASGQAHGGYNMTKQESTEAIYLFGSSPILTTSASFYFKKGQADRYKSIEDIPDGAALGLIIGYEYGNKYESLRHKFRENRVSSQLQIIQMLLLGRIDAAIMFDEIADYTLKANDINRALIEKGFINHHSDIYVAFSKKKNDSKFFADRLDEGLNVIRGNGIYEKIMAGELH